MPGFWFCVRQLLPYLPGSNTAVGWSPVTSVGIQDTAPQRGDIHLLFSSTSLSQLAVVGFTLCAI